MREIPSMVEEAQDKCFLSLSAVTVMCEPCQCILSALVHRMLVSALG